MKFLMVAILAVMVSEPAQARTKEFEDIYNDPSCTAPSATCKIVGRRKIIKDKDGNIKKAVNMIQGGTVRNRQVVKFEKGSGTTYDSATVKSMKNCQSANGQSGCEKFKGEAAANRVQSNKDWHAKDAAAKAEQQKKEAAEAKLAEEKQKAEEAAKQAEAAKLKAQEEKDTVAMNALGDKNDFSGCVKACTFTTADRCETYCKNRIKFFYQAPVATEVAGDDKAKKVTETANKKVVSPSKPVAKPAPARVNPEDYNVGYVNNWNAAKKSKTKQFTFKNASYCTANGRKVNSANPCK